MDFSISLGFIMLFGCLLAFAVFSVAMGRVPWDNTYPRERFRWPVWKWFPMVVITALVLALGSNLWFTERATRAGFAHASASRHDRNADIQPVRGDEAPALPGTKAAATPQKNRPE